MKFWIWTTNRSRLIYLESWKNTTSENIQQSTVFSVSSKQRVYNQEIGWWDCVKVISLAGVPSHGTDNYIRVIFVCDAIDYQHFYPECKRSIWLIKQLCKFVIIVVSLKNCWFYMCWMMTSSYCVTLCFDCCTLAELLRGLELFVISVLCLIECLPADAFHPELILLWLHAVYLV